MLAKTAVTLALTLVAAPVYPEPSPTASPSKPKRCHERVNFDAASYDCEFSRDEAKRRLRPPVNRPAGPYTETRHVLYCTHDRATTDDGTPCTPCPADDEDRFTIQERTLQPDGTATDWSVIGQVCFSPGDLDGLDATLITPGRVLTEFRRLQWPRAELVIQPVGGETLVNIPTHFHVTNPEPTTQTITLLGQTIEIQATPTSWTWHWARDSDRRDETDTAHDTEAHSTTRPGGPYPHGITHEYRRTGTVRPSVDVTYTGRYRLNNGPWTDLPDTHTVPGTPQTLTILEARPTLVR